MQNRAKIQKITVHIPRDLLQIAQKATHKNITETVREGLERVATDTIYENLRRHRGKVKFSIDFNKLREDR